MTTRINIRSESSRTIRIKDRGPAGAGFTVDAAGVYRMGTTRVGFTPEGGRALLMMNKSGAPSVKGTIVEHSYDVDEAWQVCHAGDDHPIGVVYNGGVADGEDCWIVTSEIAEVLVEDGLAPSTGWFHVYISSSAAGRMAGQATVNTNRHWGEIGHCMQSKAAGVDVLAKVVLHFN
jgi:hypothetical protein